MEQKALFGLLMLFLGISHALSSRAVPLSANLKSFNEDSSVQKVMEQGSVDHRYYSEELKVEEGFIRGRMNSESDDYPGTGANNDHDPKTPGRS